VIHFNFGLHDIHTAPTGPREVPINDYEQNLRQLVKELRATGAKLIWASTTPVPEGLTVRHEADVVAYNAVAKKIMDENHIPIDDLHAFVKSWGEKRADWQLPHNVHKSWQRQKADWQLPQNVHFWPEGYTELGAQVAKYILAALHE